MPFRSSFRRVTTRAAALVVLACASTQGRAQVTGNTTRVKPDPAKPRPESAGTAGAAADTSAPTTLSGVYTKAQASKGKDVYMLSCVSCHTPPDHTGGSFWADLVGKKVAQFFSYLREEMPQDNPGSLADDDYINVLSYIFQLNAMPVGVDPLLPDTVALAKIRIVMPDSTKKGP